MKLSDLKKINLPDESGVYFFMGPSLKGELEGDVLYIGKATSFPPPSSIFDLKNFFYVIVCDTKVKSGELRRWP